ncbi:MAG TPA: hypothetical protein VK864_21000, partial [Longimicrobiales bacterium]|nr:hypothetical protein [Longimicrobiales bacterium]
RATAKLMESYPLTVGAGFSTREFRVSSTPTIETRDGVAFEVDFELGDFRRKGLHLFGEVTTGRNLAIADGVDNENFLAAQGIATWFAPLENARVEGWELAGRLSWGDPRRGIEDDEAMLLTPGVNLYFSGRNRIMLNWDVLMPTGSAFSTEHVVRAQAQVYF